MSLRNGSDTLAHAHQSVHLTQRKQGSRGLNDVPQRDRGETGIEFHLVPGQVPCLNCRPSVLLPHLHFLSEKKQVGP